MPATEVTRTTNETVKIERDVTKIALEEAVQSCCFNATQMHPPARMVEVSFFASEHSGKDMFDRLSDVAERLTSMDRGGVQYAIQSLTAPGIEGVGDAATAIEFARKTNDGIYRDYVQTHPHRFGFFCSVPLQDPEAAAKELHRCVTTLGAKGVLVNGFSNISAEDPTKIRYLDAPENEPFWKMLSQLDVPLYLHPHWPAIGQQRFHEGYPNLCGAGLGFLSETAAHAFRIMCSGVFDRYPNVRLILGHLAEALPFMIYRAENRVGLCEPGSDGPYKKSLVDYLRDNIYATMSGNRSVSALRCTMEEMGETRVMYSVDYPYESNEESGDWFDGLNMSASTRKALGRENAERLLKLSL